MSKSSYFYFYFFTIAPIWHQIWKLDLDCLFVCNAITHERFDISSLNLAHICIIRVPQPLYRLANKGPFSHRLANNSKTFLEYRISVCHWVSNKCKIVFFVNTRPFVLRKGPPSREIFKMSSIENIEKEVVDILHSESFAEDQSIHNQFDYACQFWKYIHGNKYNRFVTISSREILNFLRPWRNHTTMNFHSRN